MGILLLIYSSGNPHFLLSLTLSQIEWPEIGCSLVPPFNKMPFYVHWCELCCTKSRLDTYSGGSSCPHIWAVKVSCETGYSVSHIKTNKVNCSPWSISSATRNGPCGHWLMHWPLEKRNQVIAAFDFGHNSVLLRKKVPFTALWSLRVNCFTDSKMDDRSFLFSLSLSLSLSFSRETRPLQAQVQMQQQLELEHKHEED